MILLFLEMTAGPVVEVLPVVTHVVVGRLLCVHLRSEDGQKVEERALVGMEATRSVLHEVRVVGYLHSVSVVVGF